MTMYHQILVVILTHMDSVIKGPEIGYTHKFQTFRQYLILIYIYIHVYIYIHTYECLYALDRL